MGREGGRREWRGNEGGNEREGDRVETGAGRNMGERRKRKQEKRKGEGEDKGRENGSCRGRGRKERKTEVEGRKEKEEKTGEKEQEKGEDRRREKGEEIKMKRGGKWRERLVKRGKIEGDGAKSGKDKVRDRQTYRNQHFIQTPVSQRVNLAD